MRHVYSVPSFQSFDLQSRNLQSVQSRNPDGVVVGVGDVDVSGNHRDSARFAELGLGANSIGAAWAARPQQAHGFSCMRVDSLYLVIVRVCYV